LKQGYFDGTKYYGESYFAYLQLAGSVQLASSPAPVAAAPVAAARAARAAPAKRARKTHGSPITAVAAGTGSAKARARKRAGSAGAKPR
jgi:hypothetical protein